MTAPRVWYCCAKINRSDKGYFAHQVDGFETLDPQVVTWEDGRPAEERGDSAVLPTSFHQALPFRGGHRLHRALLHAKAMISDNPFAASGSERAALMALAKRVPPKLLYCHTGFVALRLMPVAKAFDVPLVVHSHGLDINIPDPLHQRIYKAHLPRINHVSVVARWMLPWFLENGYDPDKTSIVPMGVPLASDGLGLGQRDEPPYFVFVGRLVRYKGINRTIEAFAKVHAQHPEAVLRIVGGGPIEQELRAQVSSLGLEAAIEFTGGLPGDKTKQMIAGAAALVHHALNEPDGPEAFPTVVSEAMALGTPVVGSRCGGIPDQVAEGETGYLIDQHDTETMAARMMQILQDPELGLRLGQTGRQHAEDRLDSVKLARKMEDILGALS